MFVILFLFIYKYLAALFKHQFYRLSLYLILSLYLQINITDISDCYLQHRMFKKQSFCFLIYFTTSIIFWVSLIWYSVIKRKFGKQWTSSLYADTLFMPEQLLRCNIFRCSWIKYYCIWIIYQRGNFYPDNKIRHLRNYHNLTINTTYN